MCNLHFKVNIKRGKMGPQIWNGHQNSFVKYFLSVGKKTFNAMIKQSEPKFVLI